MPKALTQIVIALCLFSVSSLGFSLNLAGETISNTAQINFSVNGSISPPIVATAELTIDRKLDVKVQSQLNAPQESLIGTTSALPFTISNLSNTEIGVLLTTKITNVWTTNNQTYNTNLTFAPSDHMVYVDVNNNGSYEPTIDTQSSIYALAPNAMTTVFVVTDMPTTTITANDFAGVSLIVQVASTGTVGIPDSVTAITNDNRGNTSPAGQYANGASVPAGVVNNTQKNSNLSALLDVFSDAAGALDSSGNNDISSNGQHSATSGYALVDSPLTINKTAQPRSADGNSPAQPVAGNIIRYQLTVAATKDSQNISITDVIPDGTIYKTNSITLDGNALTDAIDADTGEYLSPSKTVQLRLNQLLAGETRQIIFDVHIE